MHTELLKTVFWAGMFIVFYAYLGYGIVLFLWVSVKRWFRKTALETRFLPEVTVVVCAYNEKDWITQKIANSLALEYPVSLIHFLFVTDGSDDGTDAQVQTYPYPAGTQWQLLHQPERKAKIAAFQPAM